MQQKRHRNLSQENSIAADLEYHMMPSVFTVQLFRKSTKDKNHTGHTNHRFQKDIFQATTATLQNVLKCQKKIQH